MLLSPDLKQDSLMWHTEKNLCVSTILQLRRRLNGEIGHFIKSFFNRKQNDVEIYELF